MKKTLLLAAALACSGVAQAEIFSCTSTYGAVIDEYRLVNAPIVTQSWVVDTTRGLRVSEDNRVVKDYAGDCEVRRGGGLLGATCVVYGVPTHIVEILESSSGEITFLASVLRGFNFSYAGFCTEI